MFGYYRKHTHKLAKTAKPFTDLLKAPKSKQSQKIESGQLYTLLQNRRMRGCGGAGCPLLIILKRLKLPQQIIYCRKENLSESPNHFKYLENILISRFYDQFLRSSWNLVHFWKFKKISNS